MGINRFGTDSEEELQAVREAALAAGAFDAVVCSHFAEGGKGAVSEGNSQREAWKANGWCQIACTHIMCDTYDAWQSKA